MSLTHTAARNNTDRPPVCVVSFCSGGTDAKAFVLNWIEQLRQYQDTVPLADRLLDTVQRTMLQNAVQGLDTLQQVQITSDLQQTTHETVLTFAQYRSLLLNAAILDTTSEVISTIRVESLVVRL